MPGRAEKAITPLTRELCDKLSFVYRIPPTVWNRESASRILERSQKVQSFVQCDLFVRIHAACWSISSFAFAYKRWKYGYNAYLCRLVANARRLIVCWKDRDKFNVFALRLKVIKPLCDLRFALCLKSSVEPTKRHLSKGIIFTRKN